MTTLGATGTHHAEAFATSDGWWAIKVVGMKFGYTQAAHREDVEEVARDLIAGALDVDETEVGEVVVSERVWT